MPQEDSPQASRAAVGMRRTDVGRSGLMTARDRYIKMQQAVRAGTEGSGSSTVAQNGCTGSMPFDVGALGAEVAGAAEESNAVAEEARTGLHRTRCWTLFSYDALLQSGREPIEAPESVSQRGGCRV